MLIPAKSTAVLVAGLILSGCFATKGSLEKAVNEQRAALDAERAERVAGDERLAAELAQLRTDLQAMRTEFGAKISAVENGLQFAMPVHFAFDDANVQTTDQAALDRFADIVTKYYTGSVVTVEGFADPAGTRAYNKRLSAQRADAVRSYLLTRNITAQVRTVGYGEDRLVVPEAAKDEPGAELNRRVVFVIESPKATAAQVTALLD
jgi:peptidoglycan-associated lipoprotein